MANSPDWEALREVVKTTDKNILTKVVNSIDGHAIYDTRHFTEVGLDTVVVNAFCKNLHSGKLPKEMIYGKDGLLVASMNGIYGLDLLEFIASTFDVKSWKMGRGSRADHLAEQLIAKFSA